MINLKRNTMNLESGLVVDMMDWEVAIDIDFNGVVAASTNDNINLDEISFSNILDPNIEYFARCRARINDGINVLGWTSWSNIDVFDPIDTIETDNHLIIPSKVNRPILTTDSNITSHDVTLFTITASGFDNIGIGELEATDWIIEDISGNVIWSSLGDRENTTSIKVSSVMLGKNKPYVIKAIFHSTTNDSSEVGSLTITTHNNNIVDMYTTLTTFSSDGVSETRITGNPNITSVTWELHKLVKDLSERLFSETVTTGDIYSTTYGGLGLSGQAKYIVRIKTNISTNFEDFLISTY